MSEHPTKYFLFTSLLNPKRKRVMGFALGSEEANHRKASEVAHTHNASVEPFIPPHLKHGARGQALNTQTQNETATLLKEI